MCVQKGYHKILRDIGPRIVIVEEAAEVFEAHVLSSLSQHCEHLILIGDHVQLRPNPTVYKLATDYKIDVSLFERLLNNDIKKVMLTTQHRMRPDISILMRHFYENKIIDNDNVKKYPNIRGMRQNVCFISHNQMENKKSTNDTSKTNIFEAEYLASLCNHLIRQQYKEEDITILTMYLGQLSEIKHLLRDKFKLKKVKVSNVDNYQGEENDIILLSLVRSNAEQKIGFLSIENRVCVALSRAKHGFYCIGNFDMIARQSKKWFEITRTLKEFKNLTNELVLSCGQHPSNDIVVKKLTGMKLNDIGFW